MKDYFLIRSSGGLCSTAGCLMAAAWRCPGCQGRWCIDCGGFGFFQHALCPNIDAHFPVKLPQDDCQHSLLIRKDDLIALQHVIWCPPCGLRLELPIFKMVLASQDQWDARIQAVFGLAWLNKQKALGGRHAAPQHHDS